VKLSCNGADLGKALRTACAVAPARTTYPALSCVRLDAADDKLAITATNLDMQVTVKIDASVSQAGSALVNAGVMRGLARSGHAAFELQGDSMIFRGASSSATLATMPVEDFPVLARDGGFEPVDVNVADLLDCMKFCATEEVRYYLRGVCVDEGHLVATDGHQLFTVEGGGGKRQIIPGDAAAVLSAMPNAKLSLSGAMWRATSDGTTAYGKLIDGTFPDWTRIIPRVDAELEIQADDLAGAAKAISPVFDQRVRRIAVSSADCAVRLTAEGGFGAAEATAPATGDDGRASVNGKYLEGICAAFSGQTVKMSFGPDALLFTAGNRRAVVMGMR